MPPSQMEGPLLVVPTPRQDYCPPQQMEGPEGCWMDGAHPLGLVPYYSTE